MTDLEKLEKLFKDLKAQASDQTAFILFPSLNGFDIYQTKEVEKLKTFISLIAKQ